MEDMIELDKNLADTLMLLKDLGNQKDEIDRNTSVGAQQQLAMIKKLTFKVVHIASLLKARYSNFLQGCNIQDLGLVFTFPGFDDIFLLENGDKIPVNISNVQKYVHLVVQFFFNKTIKLQVTAFREGFQSVLNFFLF
jgi:E3 ubiquitin-protein ligase TRIP12